jgi:uncharacterized membrane protein
MDASMTAWIDPIFRWIHVVSGIMWIGHLYFFNFVNAQVAKTYDADSKKKVIPELMPRALYWFRWGAAYTWITGFFLAGLVYYMPDGQLVPEGSSLGKGAAIVISLGIMIVAFFVYDFLWKALASNETAGVAVSFLIVAVSIFCISRIFVGRAVYIQLGATFGTIMAMNVWMRIWPSQKKIITAIKGGTAPDGALVSLAGMRSKHNTYMSVPLVFSMFGLHTPQFYGGDYGWALLILVVIVGWATVKLLYGKSAGPAPAQF